MNFLTKFESWDPLEELSTLRNRMDRLRARVAGDPTTNEELFPSQWVPASDVLETKNAIVVKAELPGLTEKDITVEIENGMLVIKGERKFEKETDDKGYRRIERAYGNFLRTFTLPPNVAQEKIHATFTNGLLEVEIPKKEEARPKTINVAVTKKLSAAA
jgi:HSP20 family protein